MALLIVKLYRGDIMSSIFDRSSFRKSCNIHTDMFFSILCAWNSGATTPPYHEYYVLLTAQREGPREEGACIPSQPHGKLWG